MRIKTNVVVYESEKADNDINLRLSLPKFLHFLQ